MARQLRSITVQELIDLLEGEDPDATVVFSADYGDYSHTEQALPIKGETAEARIEESGYSHSGWALVDPEEDDDEDEDRDEPDGQKVLVIR